jgi:hypothetical protein
MPKFVATTRSRPTPGGTFHYFWDLHAKLTSTEEEQFEAALYNLQVFQLDIELFAMAIANWRDFHSCLDDQFAKFINRRTMDFNPRAMSFQVNRYLLNWLGSIRIYLDHTEARLKRRYGQNSTEWQRFDQMCHDSYDDIFAYRFIYGLRNIALHSSLPITEIQLSTVPSEADPKTPAHALVVGCNRDKLVAEKRWNKRLRIELASQPPTIEITALVDEMMRVLQKMCLSLAESSLTQLQPDALFINQLLQRAPSSPVEFAGILGAVLKPGDEDPLHATAYFAHELPMALIAAAISGQLTNAVGDIPNVWDSLNASA